MSGDVFGRAGQQVPAGVAGDDEEPAVDLRALAGARGPAGWEALAARIEAAAAPELARRAAGGRTTVRGTTVRELAPVLARALRPAFLAAAAALLMAVGLSWGTAADAAPAAGDEAPAGQLVSDASVAQALAVREADAPWLAEGQAPSREALARAIGVEPAGGGGADADAGSGERP